MDFTEDLSARVLINQILNTELPRTPFTRSEPQASGSAPRRSSRLRKDAEPQTPQNILRRSQKHKIRESITRKSMPSTKRRTSVVLRKRASSTAMFSTDGETPRHLLMNILQTDPVKSPVVHEEVPPAEPQPPSADNTVTTSHSSVELSGLDLSDVTLGNEASSTEGLSRKRPRRSLNVSAFAKRLKDQNEDKADSSIGSHSSVSLSSFSSLDLKTPFVEVHTEKRGLQRRASNRRKITVEDFNAALEKQQIEGHRLQNQNLGDDTNFEGITLGLSKLSEPDITEDIMNCHTALYDHQDAATSGISIIATQDKPTVFASQLQRDLQEEEEEQSEKDGKELVNIIEEEDPATDPDGDEGVSDSQDKDSADKAEPEDAEAEDPPDGACDSALLFKSEEKKDAAGSQTFDLGDEAQYEEEAVADPHSEDDKGGSESEQDKAEDEQKNQSQTEEEAAAHSQAKDFEDAQSEQGEAAVGSPTEDDGMDQSQTEEEAAVESGSEKEEALVSSQTGDEARDRSLTEEKAGLPENQEAPADYLSERVEGDPQSEQDEAAVGPPAEEEGMDRSETVEKAAVQSQTFDLENKDEEIAAESQPEDTGAASQSEEEEALVSSQTGDEARDKSLTEEEAGLPENEEAPVGHHSEGVEGDPQSEQDEAAVGPSVEEKGMDRSETMEKAAVQSQTFDLEDKDEEVAAEPQPEDTGAVSQSEEEEAAAGSQPEGEGGSETQAEEVMVNKSRSDVQEELEDDGGVAVSQTEEDYHKDEREQEKEWRSENLEHDVRYISHRAYRSEGRLIPLKRRDDPTEAPAAGRSYTMSKGPSALGLNSSTEMGSQFQSGISDWPKPSLQDQEDDSGAEKDLMGGENTSAHQICHDVEVCEQQSDPPAEEVPSEDAGEQEKEWDEEDDDEEVPTKTPAFVREKRHVFVSNAQASPSVFRKDNKTITSDTLPAAKPKQVKRRKNEQSRKETVLPKSYLMSTFKHFAKTRVSADVFPVLNEIMDTFLTRAVEDLEVYAAHAKRKTIEVEDVKLLLRRQGHISDEVPVEVLIEKYLRMEQRKILIPIATSGNVVIP
ncbi:PREDICTED: glutamic acid-rich protein-like isoform X1 [Cyprinodon variegatus]|uniref:Glutamic acid-rich protein-like n=1 Tax=Cyprinodon variegatus TaxID=28743 RepID=A0A3Q2DSF6_CYPVA|nr:PREDICTED: glutamic acid-rich protein-like isoform X1 [Cyprinodon variegatus]